MDQLLQGLKAAAESTRLRVLCLCAHAELTVSELVEVLGQSQPRVSRHLKLLVEAGLLERHQEGSWAYYRPAEDGPNAELVRLLVDMVPAEDAASRRDLKRLEEVKASWAVKADAYFRRNAANWSKIRALHVDASQVDRALSRLLGEGRGELLDIGTGTGHVLLQLGARFESAVGIDRSLDMLNVARANLFRAGLRNCQVRHADMGRLPFPEGRFDAVTIHMVLHYADEPGAAVKEAARVLKPGGRLVVVDFAPHERRELAEEHAHRWLGFSEERIGKYFADAGLVAEIPVRLAGGALTVCLWPARRAANDATLSDPALRAG